MSTHSEDPVIPGTPMAPGADPEPSPIGLLLGALTSPVATFRSLARRPVVAVAFAVLVVVPVIPSFLALPKIDWEGLARLQFERMDREPTEAELEQAISGMETFGPIGTYASPFILAIGYLIVGAAFWGAFNAVGGELSYKASLATSLHAMAPFLVGALLAIPVVLARSEISAESLQTGSLLASNAAFLAPDDTGPVALALLASLDLFTLWAVALLAVGFSIVAGVSRGAATVTVLALWLVWIGVKVGFAALGAMFGGGG